LLKIKNNHEISQERFRKIYSLLLEEKLQKADVIVWLQGDRYDRAPKALELYKKVWGKKIVISGNNVLIGKKKTRRKEYYSWENEKISHGSGD